MSNNWPFKIIRSGPNFNFVSTSNASFFGSTFHILIYSYGKQWVLCVCVARVLFFSSNFQINNPLLLTVRESDNGFTPFFFWYAYYLLSTEKHLFLWLEINENGSRIYSQRILSENG